MKINAEAVRPGTVIVWQGTPYKVLSNDTLERRFVLEDADFEQERRPLNYEPGVEFTCSSVPHRRQERDQGDADVIFVILVTCLLVAFIIIAIAAVSILTKDDSENRQSCLERNGAILEDESGTMTGCIIDRENP